MKKILLTLLVCTLTVGAYAQSNQKQQDESYYKGIESYQDLHLTADQIAKIKKLKREVGPKFAAIDRDRSLTGYEKGQKKRELAQKHRQEIENVLNQDQISLWEKKYGKYTSLDDIKDKISDNFDEREDALEVEYETEKSNIEKNSYLDKSEKKAQKRALKEKYKEEKKKLKNEKEKAKKIV
ncbi:MAG: hypothetical protein LBV43_08065 [Prevotella sp.]|jgi:hypothetical protein|nr:hypothetical protein [Prevotella sp.]